MDETAADPVLRGEGGSPFFALDGFAGPLELLLILARAHQVDLARLSLPALVDQLAVSLQRTAPLAQKGEWVVTASWLLLLRSRLLLPADDPVQQEAAAEADHLRGRLVGLQAMQAFAAWLDRRPQLGRDVFVRGQPEEHGTVLASQFEVDVIAFLWASLELFEDAAADADTASFYRPLWLDLHSVPDARARILRLLAENPEGQSLDRLLPEHPGDVEVPIDSPLQRRSAWASTFSASLELAKQGEVAMDQGGVFTSIHVRPSTARLPG